MKICMFTNTYLPHVGGVARSVSFFAEDLCKAGHRVLVIAPTYPGNETHGHYDPDTLRLPAIQKFNGSDFSLRIPVPFLVDEKLDDFDPDIIHSHHPYLLGDAALRVARRRQLPLIFTHHTLYEEYTHYIVDNPENMKRFAAFLSTNYAGMCDRVIAPSQSIKDLIRERGVTAPISIVPTGVDTAFFANGDGVAFRKSHGISTGAMVIGHLGRLAPEKNLAYLARAVAHAMERLPEAHFLVVGEGPSQKEIAHIFDQAGLHDRLVLAGEITGHTLADAYHAMNLFVFASQSETQGMVLTEAMAAGVPVMALDASGVREVVDDGRNGRLLEADASPERFAKVLVETAAAPDRLAEWIRRARQTAKAFSRERSAKELLRLYEKTVRARQEAGASKTQPLDLGEKFLLACRAEWDLATEKAESLLRAMDDEEQVVGIDEAG